MSYRQPKYIAPADANIAIDKFNDSMKAFADEAKSQRDAAFCRDNPGACKDDKRKADDSTDDNTTPATPTTSAPTKALKPPISSKPKSTGTKINFGTGVSGTVGGVYNVNYDPMDPSTWQ